MDNLSTSGKNSAAIWAVALFALVNLAAYWLKDAYEKHRGGYKSCDHIINTFSAKKLQPNIVLLGSSLMRMPFYLSDTQNSKDHPKYEYYCWSHKLQKLFRDRGIADAKVFNLSIDGAMASDVCLMGRKLLKGNKTPNWIVYGIGPRDFVDGLFTKETRTAVYNRLFDLKDFWSRNSEFRLSLNERLGLVIEKFCFLYDLKEEAFLKLDHIYLALKQNFLDKIQKPAEYIITSEGLMVLSPSPQTTWDKSIAEYSKRYKNCGYAQISRQKRFFKEFCQESNQKGIKILLVNMPITKENLDLIPSITYTEYQKIVTEASKYPGLALLDLQHSNKFPKKFFGDSVHLNEKGGDLLCEQISRALSIADKDQGLKLAAVLHAQN